VRFDVEFFVDNRFTNNERLHVENFNVLDVMNKR